MYKKIAVSSSLEGIKNLISKYYKGSSISLIPVSDKEYKAFNAHGPLIYDRVFVKNKRYYFYQERENL